MAITIIAYHFFLNVDALDIQGEVVPEIEALMQQFTIAIEDDFNTSNAITSVYGVIKEINKTFPTYKYIKDLILTDEELIKTTTKKIKRPEEMKKILAEV